jgi:hypothetical protein
MADTPPPEDRRTPEDIRNGWSLGEFNAYHAEREKVKQETLDWSGRPKKRPTMQTRYSPLRRWVNRGLIDRS